MSAEEILRAIEHYGLTVFGPPRGKVAKGCEWHARDEAGDRQGWGSTPAEAVEAAVATKPQHNGFLCQVCGEDLCEHGAAKLNGLTCVECGEDQYDTPRGTTCRNGHGGVDGYDPNKAVLAKCPSLKPTGEWDFLE